jgi:hypothetical protein
MGFQLSKQTARKVKSLLLKGDRGGTPSNTFRGTGRFDIHVKITGPEEEGYYPCVTCDFACDTEAWNEYTDTSYALSSNDEPLTEGRRYRAINYGAIDGFLIFAVDTGELPEAGCALEYDAEGKLGVNAGELAGCGLVVEDVDSGTCDKLAVDVEALAGAGLQVVPDENPLSCSTLAVKTGCGLGINAGGAVALDLTEVAFDGLVWNAENCTLSVNPECGLQYVGTSGIGVDHASLAGDGLQVQDNSGCDSLAVKTGCGIVLDGAKAVAVDHASLAGNGLEVADESGCDKLAVRPSCHIDVTADGVAVNLDTVAGPGLEVVPDEVPEACSTLGVKVGCGLEIDVTGAVAVDTVTGLGPTFSAITSITKNGCGITYTVTPFAFAVNACGVFLGFAAGTPANYSIDLCPDCGSCTSSSSSSSSSPSSSSSSSPSSSSSSSPSSSSSGSSCSGTCNWLWYDGSWSVSSSSCGVGCLCESPTREGRFEGDTISTLCISNGFAMAPMTMAQKQRYTAKPRQLGRVQKPCGCKETPPLPPVTTTAPTPAPALPNPVLISLKRRPDRLRPDAFYDVAKPPKL